MKNQKSFRDHLTEDVMTTLKLDKPRALQLYLEFCSEAPNASAKTKRKLRKSLGID